MKTMLVEKALAAFGLATVFVPLCVVAVAPLYSIHSVGERYRSGPWVNATIQEIFVTNTKGGNFRYQARVIFSQEVAGKLQECRALANLGQDGLAFHTQERFKIAPHHGSCADVATKYDFTECERLHLC